MTLAEQYVSAVTEGWKDVFPDSRTHRRAIEHALAWPSAMGDRTISQDICMLGRSQADWSADYKMYSRSPWNAEQLFEPVMDEYLKRYPQGPVVMPMDDTKVQKKGKHIPGASWQRDPMSPPFHVNYIWGLRFLQASLVFAHHQEGTFSARAFPVRFEHVPVVPKPKKAAPEEEWTKFHALRKTQNLSTAALRMIEGIRQLLNQKGAPQRQLLVPVDGSFCNRTLFKAPIPGVDLLARCRKDARLCFPDLAGSRRRYAAEIFTPEDVRKSDRLDWGSKRKVVSGLGFPRLVEIRVLCGFPQPPSSSTEELVAAPFFSFLGCRRRRCGNCGETGAFFAEVFPSTCGNHQENAASGLLIRFPSGAAVSTALPGPALGRLEGILQSLRSEAPGSHPRLRSVSSTDFIQE